MPLLVQLREREDFEARTLRALGGGAAAGLLAVAASGLLAVVASRLNVQNVPVDAGFFAVAGAALAGAHTDWKMRVGMLVGLPVLLNLPDMMNVPSPLSEACMGVLAAGVVGWLGTRWKPKPSQVLAGAVGAGALVPLGLYVKAVMDTRLFNEHPGALGTVLGLAAVALFWSVGTLAAHVTVHGNAVEARGTALEQQLSGEAQGLVSRAMALYRQCHQEAARLTAGPGKTELVGVLEKMAREVFTLGETYAGLEAQLRAVRQGDVDAQVKELRAKAAATTDAVARRQLELAASSLGEELNHLDLLDRKRERLLAQMHAQVALLERARVSLVGVRGGDVASKGAQAAQLARKLAALGQEEDPVAPAPAPLPDSTRVGS